MANALHACKTRLCLRRHSYGELEQAGNLTKMGHQSIQHQSPNVLSGNLKELTYNDKTRIRVNIHFNNY